jgi:cysteine synthase A
MAILAIEYSPMVKLYLVSCNCPGHALIFVSDGYTLHLGLILGVSRYLKSKNERIKAVLADPPGSVLYHWFKTGEIGGRKGVSITEGIGQGRVTNNLQDTPLDNAIFVSDEKSVEMTFRLLHEEGFCVGASSGLNVAAAVQISKEMPSGSVIVTCLCDSGQVL